MRKLLLFVSFFAITPLFIFVTIAFFAYYTYAQNSQSSFISLQDTKFSPAYAALPSNTNQFSGSVIAEDARVEKLRNFYLSYHAPLADYAEELITVADKNDLDWRLLPAISMQESGGGKKMRANSNNAFGWGNTATHTTSFANFSESIESIGRQFAKNYVGQGLNTVESIGKKYNPDNTNDWTSKVKYFMEEIQSSL